MSPASAAGEPSRRPFSVTHRSVLAIAIPMTLGYLSTPLLGVVDMAVIGRLGNAALLGGIALGGIIFDLVFTTFNFLRAGTTGLTAQAVGGQDDEEVKATLARALVIAALGGLLVVLLQSPLLYAGAVVPRRQHGRAGRNNTLLRYPHPERAVSACELRDSRLVHRSWTRRNRTPAATFPEQPEHRAQCLVRRRTGVERRRCRTRDPS